MSIAIVLAAPLVGMGIGSLIAFGALGSSALNIPALDELMDGQFAEKQRASGVKFIEQEDQSMPSNAGISRKGYP